MFNLKWLPIGFGFTFSVGSLIVLVMNIYTQKSSELHMPFISEAGGSPPASFIFAISLVITAFFGIFTYMTKYLIVEKALIGRYQHLSLANKFTLIVEITSMFGMILVAVCPLYEPANAIPHTIGATLLIGLSLLGGYGRLWLNFKIGSVQEKRIVSNLCLRAIYGYTATFIIMTSFTFYDRNSWRYAVDYEWMWTLKERSTILQIGALAEWILIISTVVYIGTYASEFSEATISIDSQPLAVNGTKENEKKG